MQDIRKGPDVVFHIRTRINYCDLKLTHQVGAGPIQGERPAVPSFDYPGLQRLRTLAALGYELLCQLVGNQEHCGLVLGSEGIGLHGVDVDKAEHVLTGPNQNHHL